MATTVATFQAILKFCATKSLFRYTFGCSLAAFKKMTQILASLFLCRILYFATKSIEPPNCFILMRSDYKRFGKKLPITARIEIEQKPCRTSCCLTSISYILADMQIVLFVLMFVYLYRVSIKSVCTLKNFNIKKIYRYF